MTPVAIGFDQFIQFSQNFRNILSHFIQLHSAKRIEWHSQQFFKDCQKTKNRFEIFLYKFVGTDSKKNLKNHDRGQGAITTIFLQTIKQFKYVIGAEELFENFVWITELGRSFAAGQFTFEK